MNSDINNLQLKTIHYLLEDARQAYAQSAYFEQALSCLSQLLDSSLLIHTSIYKDKNNLEYQLTNHLYSTDKKSEPCKHSLASFEQANKPEVIQTLYQQKSEILVQKSQLMHSFFYPQNAPTSNLGDEYALVVIPFFYQDDLVGILSYKSEQTTQVTARYPAVFSTIHAIFENSNKEKSSEIESATYQMVLDLMPQRVFWKNRQSVYLGCNKAFADDASVDGPDNIIGLTDYDFFPEQANLYRSDDANTMETLEHLVASEEPQTHANGETIWLRTSKRPIIDQQDNVIGVVGTYDDITQLKGIQHELQKAKSTLENRVNERTKELSRSNQKLESAIVELKTTQNQLIENEKMAALGSLVAGIAHEINTPLGVAVTSASHLEHVAKFLNTSVASGTLSKNDFITKCDEIIDSSDLILRNLERASELVRSFKMIAVDQSNDEIRDLFIYKYLGEVVHALSPKASKKNIRIFLNGDENLQIKTYPGAISQLATNLLDNAFIHAFDNIYNGEIKISFKVIGDQLELKFQDNGQGMDEETTKQIFDPFYTTQRGKGGTGLGLSIVYNLVTQKLNGSITCQSKHDEWTRFTLVIPLNIV
ncbi:ATP-binding protein [Thalassotalea sp. PLHSN55]|uniref:PAS domain-containing sensor histidine kinase n=1 Tax=Thalassotalea sp. PLHSN55 TaxID=3435888 RepID=UPI003F870350